MNTNPKQNLRKKTIISGALLICTSFLFARGIIEFSSGASIGTMARAFLPAIGFLGLFIIIYLALQEGISWTQLFKRERGSKTNWWLGVPLAIALVPFILIGAEIGLTYSLVAIIVIFGFLLSSYLFLTRDDAYGVIPFFLVYPFIGFFEWSFYEISGEIYLGPFTVSPAIISIWLIFLVSLIRRPRQSTLKNPNKRITFFILVWVVVTCLSAIKSIDPLTSFRQCSVDLFVLPLVAFLIMMRVKEASEARDIFWALLACNVLRIAITYYFLLRSPLYASNPGIISLYGASYLLLSGGPTIVRAGLMSIPIAFYLFMVSERKSLQLFLLMILSGLFFLVIICQVRAIWLAAILTLPIVLMQFRKKIWAVALMIVAFASLLAAIFTPDLIDSGLERLTRWSSIENFKYDQRARIDAFKSGLKMVRDYPLLGIGPGMWPEFYPQYSSDPVQFFNPNYKIGSAHNFFIQYVANSGLLGFGALFLIILSLYKTLFRNYKRLSGNWKDRTMLLAIIWSVTLFLFDGDDSFYRLTVYGTPILDRGVLFWSFLGQGMALDKIYNT